MNVLDKVISVFSPEAGLKRAASRQMLDHFRERDYASAQTGRRNKAWRARATSANVEVGGALGTLRNRARDFVRNRWMGQRILDVLTSHVVGTGITVVPNTGSDRADKAFSSAWEEWQEVSDAEGVMGFGAMQALTVRSMVEGGDSVVRMIDLEMGEADGSVPMRLLGLEGDQIDTSRDRYFADQTVRLGVQLGKWGRRKGLWLLPEHPGDMSLASVAASSLVAWEDLCHLYRPLRFGQVRGISWFAPLLVTASEIQDLMEAAIVQARTQASFAGFIKRQPGGMNVLAATKDEKGKPVTRIEPGMIADIGEADITFSNPSSQSAFAETYIAGMQAMAAGAGLTYDQMTGDLRQANYSSLRAGKIEFRRLVEQIQYHIVGPRLCMPVARRFADRAVMAGKLAYRRAGYPCDLIMPANEPIDPKKDLEADILAVRAGRMSPQEFISAWGSDWRKVVADFKTFFATIDGSGVALDIDPRRPAGGRTERPEPAPET
ncbi:phage portal protein [Sinorhizobium sp. BG8]|uniref:phage portal protein n=1 Tax=Sinorhizobium sp. BG8 TaxID=2613773 RepID=UPI00193D1B42|nr:phage portal protein [Sinorhizobium sp. BG8]QRM55139.1 phage portal protein [Sinorhizobium sp. BG8]